MKIQGKETKITFYKTMAIPVIAYNPETWRLIKRKETKNRKSRY
jgi:hypothetical protein